MPNNLFWNSSSSKNFNKNSKFRWPNEPSQSRSPNRRNQLIARNHVNWKPISAQIGARKSKLKLLLKRKKWQTGIRSLGRKPTYFLSQCRQKAKHQTDRIPIQTSSQKIANKQLYFPFSNYQSLVASSRPLCNPSFLLKYSYLSLPNTYHVFMYSLFSSSFPGYFLLVVCRYNFQFC